MLTSIPHLISPGAVNDGNRRHVRATPGCPASTRRRNSRTQGSQPRCLAITEMHGKDTMQGRSAFCGQKNGRRDEPVRVLQSGYANRRLLVPHLGVLIRIDQATRVMRRLGLARSFETSGNEGSVSETQCLLGVKAAAAARPAPSSKSLIAGPVHLIGSKPCGQGGRLLPGCR
jgi:hypothetical protein